MNGREDRKGEKLHEPGAEFHVTEGTIYDLETLADHRMKMWEDIHPERMDEIRNGRKESAQWIREQMTAGRYRAIIVRDSGGKAAGSGGVWIRDEPPKPGKKGTKLPYLISMYTEREYRRKGVASMVVEEAIRWSRENGFYRISLHSSAYGRGIYEKHGFSGTNEMRLNLA